MIYLFVLVSWGGVSAAAGGAGEALWPLPYCCSGSREEQVNTTQVQCTECSRHCTATLFVSFRDGESSRSKSRYHSDTIISGTSSIDRRSHGKSIDRKSSDSDYSGSGSRKSSNDRRLSASRHSLISRGSDLWLTKNLKVQWFFCQFSCSDRTSPSLRIYVKKVQNLIKKS